MAEIAVVGAGMGAMAASARLALAGHRVTVHERSGTYGGGVRRLERDGFGFDTGPGVLYLPAVYRDLFLKTGRRKLEKCVELVPVDPAERHLFPDGTDATLPNASRAGVVRALDAAAGPGAGEAWTALLDRGRRVWEAARRPLVEEPLPADPGALAADFYPAVPPPAGHGLLRRLRGPRRPARPATVADVGAGELGPYPALGTMLAQHALADGFDPRHAPAGAAMLPYVRETFGGWYVRGGMRALADALYERCLERGITFAFGAEVTAVRVGADGRAAGVELAGGERADADAVIAGVPRARLAELAPGAYEAGVPAAARAVPGRLTVCLALRGARDDDAVHRTVVHSPDAARELAWIFDGARPGTDVVPTVTVLRPDDPAQRPDAGHEAVTLTAVVPAGAWGSEATPAGEQAAPAAEAFADRMVAAAGRAVPGLAERVLWREVRTPADTAAETDAPGGAVPGPALAGAGGAYLPQPNTTAVLGLYAVGGWSHPGGGLAHAGMSGALVAGLIMEGADFRGSR
ncbi:NAD(P)/FAD-dependent oxidoreductase [Streptomyces sp. WMMC500]|uniref:phytoene desaturase family protein n=1 Tax=Streptomyces sp. WMMC500 TaxID=3015154 RepID=UPI00248CA7C2|nr:NAD(P)/FAD-dependent oxidoreductase [Streptomyces sp. WMMC500]WBB59886.1 NAD(P)/FAD-dependent oxidoreductase [Streptomyces sp. WMMC500]